MFIECSSNWAISYKPTKRNWGLTHFNHKYTVETLIRSDGDEVENLFDYHEIMRRNPGTVSKWWDNTRQNGRRVPYLIVVSRYDHRSNGIKFSELQSVYSWTTFTQQKLVYIRRVYAQLSTNLRLFRWSMYNWGRI